MKPLLLVCLMALYATSGFAQEARNVTQAIHYIKLANTLREVNKSEESISLLKRALPAVESKNLYWEAVTNELLGLSHNDLEEYEPAVRYLEIARSQYAKLKYVASAWGVNEVIRNISGKNVYAGIQIGASDVKLAIFKTQYESDFYEKDIRSVINVPDVSVVADASNSVRKGQVALQTCLDSIQRYNIPNERIFIVFGSDLTNGRNQVDKNRVYEQLASILPNGSNLRIDTTLTPAREAELFTVGTIPRKVWPTTSALNVGNNSIMGGYFDETKAFHHTTFPVGINTVVAQVDSKKSTDLDDYRREAQRIVNAIPEASLFPQDRGLQQRRTVGVGGAAVLALVTYLHPEKALTTAVPITMTDIERFKRLALSDYSSLIQPELGGISDLKARNKASQDVRSVQNQLTQKQLIAGALLLEATAKAYVSKSTPKRFVFIRDADIGWITGKFLETINYEYESTIAKGALYTR
ncbi:MAG: tetratricopeptide repeat protein [Bacteroidetes bacterium]|nr:tetratricopeptide repeat protein [Fibrella sp.]